MDYITLNNAVKYCIENFTAEEAAKRICEYIKDSLELKDKQIELDNQRVLILKESIDRITTYIEKNK